MFEKVLFLDIDGVLVSRSSAERLGSVEMFDPEAVARLREIVEAASATIVVSSMWRHQPRWKTVIRKALSDAGWEDPPIIGKTPSLPGGRGAEIDAWLQAHPTTAFIILDDDDFDLTEEQKKRLVFCGWERGLREENIQEAAEKWTVS